MLLQLLLPLLAPFLKILAGLGALFYAKRTGVKEAHAEQLELQLEQKIKADKIDKSVAVAPVSDVDKRLQPYYRD